MITLDLVFKETIGRNVLRRTPSRLAKPLKVAGLRSWVLYLTVPFKQCQPRMSPSRRLVEESVSCIKFIRTRAEHSEVARLVVLRDCWMSSP